MEASAGQPNQTTAADTSGEGPQNFRSEALKAGRVCCNQILIPRWKGSRIEIHTANHGRCILWSGKVSYGLEETSMVAA